MAVPPQAKLHRPVLEVSAERGEILTSPQIVDALTARLALTEDDLQERVSSGIRRVDSNTGWALRYLRNAGLMRQPARGKYQITETGRAFLKQHEGDIEQATLLRMADRLNPEPERTDTGTTWAATKDNGADDATPDEMMDAGHKALRDNLASDLLESLKDLTPAGFERLCVDLLEKMGYGKGKDVGRTGDGGIDGIVNQDALGLEKVYIQAKRWSSAQVGEPEIRKFSGSLNARGASKGVFISTSSFSNTAWQSAQAMRNQTIILIGGKELVQLMIEHGVGVVTQYTYEVKKIDENYFTEEL